MKYHVSFDIEFRKNLYPGIYIVFEGIDGSGKTTQADILKKYFEKKGLPAGRQGRSIVLTKEPTAKPPIGKIVHDFLKGKIKLPAVSIQYLFAADREIHQKDLIEPSLQKGDVVISDRCFWSSVAYGILDKKGDLPAGRQGVQELKNTEVLLVSESILSMYHQFIVPDMTFYINVNPQTAIERLSNMKRQREYYETSEKLKKIKAGYDFLARKFPQQITIIDGERTEKEVTADIIGKFEALNSK